MVKFIKCRMPLYLMLIDFFNSAINLKNIQRRGWVEKLSITHPESVADHSYCMAVIAMTLSDLEGCDSEKVLKMTLLHDLAESETGDIMPEEMDSQKKHTMESAALQKIFANLPEPVKSSYMDLWREYTDGITTESKLVHQIDKIEMALQASAYHTKGYQKEKLQPFFESADKEITNPALRELLKMIVPY